MRTLLRCLAALALAVWAAPTHAQGQWVYSVDFVCGFQASQDGPAGYEPLVKVANYATKLDLHNYTSTTQTLQASAVLTSSARWPASAAPVALVGATLAADGASVIDCTHIGQALMGAIPAGKPFISGVLTVKSSQPLVAWATKTTQVCAGYATLANWASFPSVQPIWVDPSGVAHFGGPGGPMVPGGRVLFGCPVAPVNGGGGVITPSGPFLGPVGAVPPGLRVPSDTLLSTGGGDLVPEVAPVSVSHALDFERVEGVQIP